MLDPDLCYTALLARDRRFDGAFFVCVATTGIYCRPICPARTPRRDRCSFYRSAAEAEKAGYRACFRCRPELAPGNGSVDAVSRLVRRAVALIEDGFLNEGRIEALAGELGVTSRHLRRSVERELGVSPVELAQTRRLALAKQLLHDTRLGLAEVAFASGFGSLRRFNALFQARFQRSPSELRRQPAGGIVPAGPDRVERPQRVPIGHDGLLPGSRQSLRLRLDYRPPLDWGALLAFFEPRAVPGIEAVTGATYRRVACLEGRYGTIAVTHDPGRPALLADVPLSLAPSLMSVVSRLRSLFDLDASPAAIAAGLSRAPGLDRLVRERPGLRVPGAFDVFETAVRAILGQQVSVRAATTLAGRLVARFGPVLEAAEGPVRAFPSPHELSTVSVDDLASLGLPRKRAACLLAVAKLFAGSRVGSSPGAASPELLERIASLEGIGEWTAQYLAMRAFRSPDAFPAGDAGIRKALGGIGVRQSRELAEAWRPWRSYAVMHLWASLPEGVFR